VARARSREHSPPLPGVGRVFLILPASLIYLVYLIHRISLICAETPRSEVDQQLPVAQIVARDAALAPAELQHHSVELLLPPPALVLSHPVEPLRAFSVLVHETLSSALDPRPTQLLEHVQQRLFVAPESGCPDLFPIFRDAAGLHLPARGLNQQPCEPQVPQLVVPGGPDYRNPAAALALHRADRRTHAGGHAHLHVVYRNQVCGHDRDRYVDSAVNADPFGSTTTDTSRCYRRMRSRPRTPRGRAATNCASGGIGCAEPRPSNYCDRPNDRSDKAPIPMARIQSTSSHKVDTRSNCRSDTAPNRCRR